MPYRHSSAGNWKPDSTLVKIVFGRYKHMLDFYALGAGQFLWAHRMNRPGMLCSSPSGFGAYEGERVPGQVSPRKRSEHGFGPAAPIVRTLLTV